MKELLEFLFATSTIIITRSPTTTTVMFTSTIGRASRASISRHLRITLSKIKTIKFGIPLLMTNEQLNIVI